MTCSLANTKLVFERSGMEIQPYKIDFRQKVGQLDYAKVRLSRKAGVYIGEHMREHEPVRIEVDGHVLRRLCLPNNPIRLGREKAWLTLSDPRIILQRGTLDKVFHRVTLGDVLDYIYNHRDDPNGVLSDVKVTDPSKSDVLTQDYEAKYSTFLSLYRTFRVFSSPSGASTEKLIPSVDVLRYVNELTGLLGREGGFDFEKVSPAEALAMVEAEFELQSFVDDNGVLWVGVPDTTADFHIAGHDDEYLRLRDYNVSEDAVPVTKVFVTGIYNVLVEGEYYAGPVAGLEERQLKAYAKALWTSKSGGRTITLDAKNIQNGDDLSLLALLRLRQEIWDGKQGEIVLNPLASGTKQSHPTDVSPGDHIGVAGLLKHGCEYEYDADLFGIEAVTHDIDSTGWETRLAVGKLPVADDIESDFWFFDPTSGETLDPDEVYGNFLPGN